MDVEALLGSPIETVVTALVADRSVSALELVDAALERAAATEPQVHAFACLDVDGARSAARSADRALATGRPIGALHGIPVGVKDVIWTADLPTEAGSAALAGFVPPSDATVVERLRAAGAIVLGKTVTHEFAWGQNVPETRCPWDTDCYPGGSSAGSGVGVAVGSLFAGLGTDTAGSIRNPAAVNGVVGLKPTNGRVSRHGVIPVSPSLDVVGPIARTVGDCAIVLTAIAGNDPRDPTSLEVPTEDFRDGLESPVAGMRVGVDRRALSRGIRPEVAAALEAALGVLGGLGVTVVEVELPDVRQALAAGLVLAYAESAAWHRPLLRERGADYAPGTRLTIELGSLVSAADYLNARSARTAIRAVIREIFERNELVALAGPTMPSATIPVDDLALDFTRAGAADDLAGTVQLLIGANLTGLPALSVPCGFSDAGLPIGLHLVGRPLEERLLLRLAHRYERSAGWHEALPVIPAGSS